MKRQIRRFKALMQSLGWVIIGNILLTPKDNYIGGRTLRFWEMRVRVICKQKNFIK